MNSRERTLAMVVAGLVVVGGIAFLANAMFLQPLSRLDKQIADRNSTVQTRLGEIAAEKKYLDAIKKLNPRLAQWQKLSLPEMDKPKTPTPQSPAVLAEAQKRHLTRVQLQYQDYLNKLLRDNKFTIRSITPAAPEARTDGGPRPAPGAPPRKPVYQVFSFNVKGEADFESVMKVLHGLYNTPLLHQVRNFSLTSQRTSKNLGVEMNVEVLMVTGAEPGEKRKGILPVFDTDKEKPPVLLARDAKKYEDVVKRNPFVPPRQIDDAGPTDTVAEKEDPEDVLSYIKLRMIDRSSYYGCRTARLVNNDARNEDVLLAAEDPPAGTPYQEARKAWEKRKDGDGTVQPLEPKKTWTIFDRFKQKVVTVNVVRVEEQGIVAQLDDKFYAVRLGDSLWDALESKNGEKGTGQLTEAQLKQLGLVADRAETLKKVKLSKLAYNDSRKGFEATFTNGDRKDESKLLAVDRLSRERSLPNEWTVKDHFGADVAALKVVKLEKDRVVFLSDKKFHAIKPDGTLGEALAKPLSAAELKALELRDRDMVLAETKLEKLEHKKDRKGFEAVLVNPERKDDKVILAVDPLPEEFDAPETWTVKDRFGTDLLAIKALKVDGNRLVFTADKKVYVLGAGQALGQALAKPLSEKEIADLGVKAP